MNRALINYFVDAGLLICLVLSGITGIIKFPGLIFNLGITYQQLPMKLISTIHDWSGIILVVLVIMHLVLHWRWIIVMTKSFFRRGSKSEGKQ